MWTCGLEGLSDIVTLNITITVVPGSSSSSLRSDPAALTSELGDTCRCRSWKPGYLFEATAKTTSERAVVAEWVTRNTFTQEAGVLKLHCYSNTNVTNVTFFQLSCFVDFGLNIPFNTCLKG